MTKIFGELDHRLSVVKRWGILHTIQNQSVAEHVHNVVRIAYKIGHAWFGLNQEELLTAILYAHHHDDEEALSGDMPAMIKPYFDEARFKMDHADLLMVTEPPPDRIKNIVKLADKMEGYHFLCIETALGNSYVERHLNLEPKIIIDWIHATFDGPDLVEVTNRVYDWFTEVGPNIRSTRVSRRGR